MPRKSNKNKDNDDSGNKSNSNPSINSGDTIRNAIESEQARLAAEKEEKRQLVLSSLDFLSKERNKTLFQLNDAKGRVKLAQKIIFDSKKRCKYFRKRMLEEIDIYKDVLHPNDRLRFIGENNNQENEDSED